MSAPSDTTNPFPSLARDIGPFAPDNIDDWVNSPEFAISCRQKAHELTRAFDSDGSDWSDEVNSLFSGSDTVSSTTTTEHDPHEVSKLEGFFYYTGLNLKGLWPRLIQRDSPDVFEEPTGPDDYVREMRLEYVPDSHEFGTNNMWETVRDWVADYLVQEGISVSSVDFVLFSMLLKVEDRELSSDEEEGSGVEEQDEESEDEDDEDVDAAYDSIAPVKKVEDGKRVYTDATVWIGVLPESLSGSRAFELTTRIRLFLNGVATTRVDIAFRESIAQPLVGQPLYRPLETGEYLKQFIDNVSVALSIPIAGRRTVMQGTLGPYFHHNNRLYAITARHNLFLANDGNAEYRYHPSAPKREVVVMGNPAFENYQAEILARISNLYDTVDSLEKQVATLAERVRQEIGLPKSQQKLTELEGELRKNENTITDLKQFYVTLSKKWSNIKDRVIGHVVWAPAIACGVGPNRYTIDLCVVELDKRKFRNFIGNVLSLGPEYEEGDFKRLMYKRIDVPSDFKYPRHGLLPLRGMLTAEDIENPNTLDEDGDRIRRVIKRGLSTNTTVGSLPRFMSFVRKYFIGGTLESLELAILPHESRTGPFSRGGDSGALIVSAVGEFVGLLTGGTNKGTDGTDITYATLFKYIWDLVLIEFPGANLYFNDIEVFLAAAPTA